MPESTPKCCELCYSGIGSMRRLNSPPKVSQHLFNFILGEGSLLHADRPISLYSTRLYQGRRGSGCAVRLMRAIASHTCMLGGSLALSSNSLTRAASESNRSSVVKVAGKSWP